MKTMAVRLTDNRTRFQCAAPEAATVFLAGDFNEWSTDFTRMEKGGDGMCTIWLPISAGRHEYKFVIDGEWRCEPECVGAANGDGRWVPNPFGTMNSVVDVR